MTIPPAFISSSTNDSAPLLNTTTFTGSRCWRSVISSPSSIASPPSPDRVTTCRPGLAGLRADGLRQRVGHGPVVERADQPAPAVHPQVAGGPDARRADVRGEDRVVGGEAVDRGRDELRVQRRLVPPVPGQLVQPAAGPPVVLRSSGPGAPNRVLAVSSGSSASTVSLTVPTSGTSTGTRRPICSPRTSTWITGTPSG